MSVQIRKGAVVVTLQNPDLGDRNVPRMRQEIQESSSGWHYRYELAAGIARERQVGWSELRRSERAALEEFFTDIARGVLEQFTWVDETGVAWNAHFLDPQLEFQSVADATSAAATFISGGATYPTTTRAGGVYSVSVRLFIWP